MSTALITQARMGSTRLPGKVMKEAGGQSFLAHHLKRIKPLRIPVIVAIPEAPENDVLAEVATSLDVAYFRGSEEDVLGRFREAADAFSVDTVVRLTSDCPLVDPELVHAGITAFTSLGDEYAYVSNTLHRTYPRGFDFEVFSARALAEADERAHDPRDREHVTPYILRSNDATERGRQLVAKVDRSDIRVTLDTVEDCLLLTTLIEQHNAHTLTGAQIIDLIDEHPELAAINSDVQQKGF